MSTVTVSLKLPAQTTAFVGREAEIAELQALLRTPDCRLLTLVGAGGMGKTRLAIEVARAAADTFVDGVYFVDVQPLRSDESLAFAIAEAIGFSFQSQEDVGHQLCRYLDKKQMLLLVDNFEHLLDQADLLLTILEYATEIKLLVTSREVLHLHMEWVRQVDGMSFPAQDVDDDLEGYSAVRLFAVRAHQVRGDFSLAAEQVDVIRICQLLQGMPLAVELAAGWTPRLSCAEIAEEIQHSIDFLATSQRDVPERHRTMRAVFEQSWRLLQDEAREVLMTLSIFHGGFRREAAVQVAGASLETLGALVDKSLLRFAPMGRYEMHELLRQFAESRLNEKPGRKQASEARHCAYFADRLIRIQNDARGARQRGFLKEMAADIENIRAAWNLAVEHRNVEAIGQLRDSLDRFNTDMNWHLQGAEAFAQAVEALRSAELTRSDTIVLGQLLASQAYSLGCLGQAERAVRLAQDGYAMLEALGARRHLFKPCWVIPWYLDSHHEGLIWFNKALALAEEFDDSFQRAQALMGLAMIESELGYLDQAEAAIAESLALFREIKILWGMAQALFVTAGIHLRQGQYDRARQSMQESLTLARASSAAAVIMLALQIAGRAADTLGLDQEAEDAYRESMMMAAQAGHEDFRVNLLVDIAAFNLNRGNSAEAHRLFRDALALAQSMKKPGDSVYALQGLGQVAASARNYQAADGYLQEGLRLSRREDWPLATASILTELGTVATRLNQMAQAKAYLTEALGLALNIHALPMLITALVAAVEWFALQGKPARAVELLMSCRDHPACHAATKRRLERLWVELDLGLSANALVPAQRHSEGVDVEVIADALLGELATESRTPHPHGQEPAPDSLSEREYDVLRLMAEGLSNQEIAERLYLAVGTVKAHTGNIYSKLDVHSRGQAVVRARAFNLL